MDIVICAHLRVYFQPAHQCVPDQRLRPRTQIRRAVRRVAAPGLLNTKDQLKLVFGSPALLTAIWHIYRYFQVVPLWPDSRWGRAIQQELWLQHQGGSDSF